MLEIPSNFSRSKKRVAAALARGEAVLEAVRFGCAAAGLSVTRPGTARSMPALAEIEAVLRAAPPLSS